MSKNGNLLIGIGPDERGAIRAEQTRPLQGLGEWLACNGEAVFGTRPWYSASTTTTEGTDVRFTRRGDTTYALLCELPGRASFGLRGVTAGPGTRARLLGDDIALETAERNGILELTLPERVPVQAAYAVELNGVSGTPEFIPTESHVATAVTAKWSGSLCKGSSHVAGWPSSSDMRTAGEPGGGSVVGPELVGSRPAPGWLIVMWVGVVAVLVVLQVVAPDGALGWWTYYSTIALAVVTAWVAVATGRRYQIPAVLLACGVTASGLADVFLDVNGALTGAYPDVSVADVGWLLAYLFVGSAMVVLLRSDRRVPGRDVDGVVDMLVVMVVAAAVVWYLWVVPMTAEGSAPWFDRLVLVSYPVLDVALLGLVVRSAVSARRHSPAIRLVAAGAVCWLISDSVFQTWGEVGMWTGIEAAGWMGAACLFAAAAWSLRSTYGDVGDTEQVRAGRWRVGVALAMFVVPWFFELVAFTNGEVIDPLPLLLVSVALAGLTYVRMTNLLNAHQLSEARVAASERRYRALAANSSDAAVVVTATGDILSGGDSLDALMGEPLCASDGANLIELAERSPDCGMAFREMFGRCLGSPETVFEVEMCMPSAGDSVRWLGARAVNLLADDDVAGVIVNFHDVTDRRRVEEEIRHHAFHDTLTGLANRALLLDRLEHAVRQSERTGWDPAVLYVRIDSSKTSA